MQSATQSTTVAHHAVICAYDAAGNVIETHERDRTIPDRRSQFPPA